MSLSYIPPEWRIAKRRIVARSIRTGLLIVVVLIWGIYER